MADLTPSSEASAREFLKEMGISPHKIEENIREYKEGSNQVKELQSYLTLLDSPDPCFLLARILMSELQKLPQSKRKVQIARTAWMLETILQLP